MAKSLKDFGINKNEVDVLSNDTLLGFIFNFLSEKVEEVKDNLIIHDKQASSKLLQSVRFKPVELINGGFRFEFIMEDYWIFVNDGRAPGKRMPPIKPIVNWIFNKPDFKAKIGGTRKGLKDQAIKKLGDIQAPANILAAAFGIAKNIQKYGQEPTHFFTDVFNDKVIAELVKEVKAKFKEDINLTLIDVAKEARERYESLKLNTQ
jgi:hypothetical protein